MNVFPATRRVVTYHMNRQPDFGAGIGPFDLGQWLGEHSGGNRLIAPSLALPVRTAEGEDHGPQYVHIPGDTTTTATISVGGSVTGVIEVRGDEDWFRITLDPGASVVVQLVSSGTEALRDPYLRIRDAAGNVIDFDDDGGEGLNSFLEFTTVEGGEFYIEADAFSDLYTGEYTLSVTPLLPVFTYDQIADQLTDGFFGGASRAFDVGADGALTVDVSGLTVEGQVLALAALEQWSAASGIRFDQVVGGAEITFDDDGAGAQTHLTLSGSTITDAAINISTEVLVNSGAAIGSYGYQVYLHEIGHALGLGHAGNYDDTADYGTDAHYRNDSWANSVMSHFDQRENSYLASLGFSFAHLVTPMNGDVVAIADLYGLTPTARADNTIYGFGSNAGAVFDAALNPAVAYTIVDAGGRDRLDFRGFSAGQLIDLNPETFSNVGGLRGNLMIARGTEIEVAIGGSGSDTIRGTGGENVLRGRGGSDRLYGGDGADALYGYSDGDALYGGGGHDLLLGGSGRDTLYGGDGNDLLQGGEDDDRIFADIGADTAFGEEGNDSLYGRDGDDVLSGGVGIDLVVGHGGNDLVSGDEGNDRVYGEAGDDVVLGGIGRDYVVGGDGDDLVNGGSGSDTLFGGSGADVFVFDTAPGGDNADGISDFAVGVDTIRLSTDVFTEIGGTLEADAFHVGEQAQDLEDRIIYDASTGALFYDADGSGAGAAVQFATLTRGLALSHADFALTSAAFDPVALSLGTDAQWA